MVRVDVYVGVLVDVYVGVYEGVDARHWSAIFTVDTGDAAYPGKDSEALLCQEQFAGQQLYMVKYTGKS